MQILPLNFENITLVFTDRISRLSQTVETVQLVLARSPSRSRCLEVILGSEEQTIVIRDKSS